MVTKKRVFALLAVVLVGGCILGSNFIYVQYISNKGPDDWGAQAFAEKYLNSKFGVHDGTMCINIVGFKPKEGAPNEGWYSMDCTYNSVSATIHAYYDGKEFDAGSDTQK